MSIVYLFSICARAGDGRVVRSRAVGVRPYIRSHGLLPQSVTGERNFVSSLKENRT